MHTVQKYTSYFFTGQLKNKGKPLTLELLQFVMLTAVMVFKPGAEFMVVNCTHPFCGHEHRGLRVGLRRAGTLHV